MTPELRAEQSRINGAKSRGPKTPQGKARSSRNSYKHGERAQRSELLRAESLAYEQRLMRWNGTAGPENDIEEFLMNDVVSISFELERARQAELERVRSRIENAYGLELEAARALGERLFFDPSGPIGVYGTRSHDWRKCRTSWNKKAADPDNPAKIVGELKSTPMGCYFLLDCWGELREHLESGGIWLAPDLLKSTRLLGRQPVDAHSDRRVADIFAASHALYRAGEAFEQLNTDMSPAALEKYLKGLRARWKDLVRTDEKAKARQILTELVDQNIAEIDAILAEHEEESPGRRDERIQAQATRDSSREGEANRRYLARCRIGLDRGLTTYRKLRKDRFERAKCGADTREIYGRGGELLGSPEPRRPAAFGTEGVRPWAQEIDAADVSACQGFVPERCTDGLNDGVAVAELAGTTADIGSVGLIAGDGAPDVGLVPKADTNDEKITNEPEVDDNVRILQIHTVIEVAANSGDESGLDKTTNEPDLGSSQDEGQIRIPLVGSARSDVTASEDAAAGIDATICLDTLDCGEISPARRVAIAGGGETAETLKADSELSNREDATTTSAAAAATTGCGDTAGERSSDLTNEPGVDESSTSSQKQTGVEFVTTSEIAPGLDNLANEPGCERESVDGGGADSVISVSRAPPFATA